MDRLLKRNQRVCPAAFCSRDLFLLHDNASVHKAARFCSFLTPKIVTALYYPVLSRFISVRLFSVPQVENEVKRAPLCGCCWEEELSAAFQKLYDRAKAFIYASGAYFEQKKKGMCLPHMSSFFKKSVQNFWTALCISI